MKLKLTVPPVGVVLPIVVNVTSAPPFTDPGAPTKLFRFGALAVVAATTTLALPVALGNTPLETVARNTSVPA